MINLIPPTVKKVLQCSPLFDLITVRSEQMFLLCLYFEINCLSFVPLLYTPQYYNRLNMYCVMFEYVASNS